MKNGGLVMLLGVLLSAGCTKTESPGKGEAAREPSVAQTVVDGVTGRNAVRAGEKARATIEKVSKEQKQMLDEILE